MDGRLTADHDTDAEAVDCAAAGPHCGVCRHVRFGDDWERTPQCERWGAPTRLSVGEVCSGFTPAPVVDPDRG